MKGKHMRSLLLTFLLAAGAVVAYGADSAPLTGNWQVHTSGAGQESDYACTITQKDTDLSGSCTPDEGTVQISGNVAGKAVTWTYKGQYGTISFKGTLDDTAKKITGTVKAEDYGIEGEFSASQSK
jgi:hypothetical protein